MFGECLETQNTCNNNVGLVIKVKQLRYTLLTETLSDTKLRPAVYNLSGFIFYNKH